MFILQIMGSCKSTYGESEIAAFRGSGETATPGLDVNDVSLMFPIPDTTEQVSLLPGGDFTNLAGKPIFSKEFFDQLLGFHRYDKTEGSDTFKLNSGSDFKGRAFQKSDFPDEEVLVKTTPDTGPYNRFRDWKITALRYDPCARDEAHSPLGKSAPDSIPSAFDPSRCLPQLRAILQPFSLRTKEEMHNLALSDQQHPDLERPVVADFAIHLIFSLSDAQSRTLYGELLSFKKECGDLTSSMPLQVQPCLLKEKMDGAFAGRRFQTVLGMLKTNATKLSALAMMSTGNGRDPWIFLNAAVVAEKLVHLRIKAVTKKPELVKRNSKGVMLEPFGNGYFQMLNLRDLGGGADAREGRQVPVSPVPLAGQANETFTEEFKIALASNGEGSDNSENLDKLLQFDVNKINRIENPLLNDFFSTDCASCHGASNLSQIRRTHAPFGDVFPGWIPESQMLTFMKPNEVSIRDVSTVAKPDTAQSSIIQSGFAGADYFRLGGYTNVMDSHSMTQARDSSLFQFAVMHFGYLGAKPSISQRAANESALSAKMANDFYQGGQKPRQLCETEALRVCLADPLMANVADIAVQIKSRTGGTQPVHLGAISYCMTKACPQRAAELKDFFGDYGVRKYRIVKDVVLNTENLGGSTVQMTAKVGSEFYALRVPCESFPAKCPKAGRILSVERLPVTVSNGVESKAGFWFPKIHEKFGGLLDTASEPVP